MLFFHSDLLSTGHAKSCSCFWMDHKSKNVCSLIDRFITSDSSDTLILPLTSKTGQSAVQNRQKTFLFGFYKKKQRTYFGILQAWFQTPDLKHTRDKTKQRGFFAFFHQFLSLHPRHQFSASPIFTVTFLGTTETLVISPAWWYRLGDQLGHMTGPFDQTL